MTADGLTNREWPIPLSKVFGKPPKTSVQEPESDPDLDLVARVLAGDTEAEETLYRLYFPKAKRLARAIFPVDIEAETAAVMAMRRVFIVLPKFKRQSTFWTFFYRVAVNRILSCRRKPKPRLFTRSIDCPPEIADPRPGPSERHEARKRLAAALLKLPKMYRTPFLLRYAEQLRDSEIARILKVSAPCVKRRVLRASAMLNKILTGE